MYKSNIMFLVDYLNNKSKAKSILQGKTYRITILTDRLIRFEYNSNGIFEDRPTEFAWFRNFDEIDFNVKEDNKFLQIKTKYFTIEYQKEKSFKGPKAFPSAYLRVILNDSDRIWYYGHPEVRNYGGSNISLDDFEGNIKLDDGLYSGDGFATIDDSNSLVINENGIFEKKDNNGIDIYLFAYRKDFGLCLKDYFKLTTFPPMIPRYALGNWWSKQQEYSDDQIRDLVLKFETEKIPISVLLLDDTWHEINIINNKKIKGGYTFNNNLFKEPKSLNAFLHNKNIKSGININPSNGIAPTEKNYPIASTYLGVTSDYIEYNPLSVKWIEAYLKLFIKPIETENFDFFWIDYNVKNKELDKLFLMNHYHTRNMEENENIRPMILSRNAKIASHRYPICYSGRTINSWNTLKTLPFYNASSANIGLSWWSHDISGFYKGIEDPELYIRYIQFGTFSPILRFSSKDGKYYKKEPWKHDYKTLSIARDYLNLRYKLIPYIYSESYKYHKNGIPLVQPIYYKVPSLYDDSKAKNEYYFGLTMLVAPIVEKKDNVMNRVIHRFYLPKGIWYDFKSGKKFIGNKDNVSFYKDEDYPVFIPAGGIIPLACPKCINDIDVPETLEIHIFPGESGAYNLYEDDGKTNSYKKGFYIITEFEFNYSSNSYQLNIKPTSGKSGVIPDNRNYKIRFKNTNMPDNITIYSNQVVIPHTSYQDKNDLIIEINNILTTSRIVITCRGENLNIEATQVINSEIDDVLSDLPIETITKEKISDIIFGNLSINKKRIEIRKLKKYNVDKKFIKLFLKLLEHVETNIKKK